MPADPPPKSLLRNLGEFFGHIWRGVKTDPCRNRRVLSRTVEEQTRDTDSGPITLRRTTIEEIEIDPPKKER